MQLDVLLVGMDADLYDEFGNYIGPELESDEEEEEGYGDREPEAQEYDVSYPRGQQYVLCDSSLPVNPNSEIKLSYL